SAYRLARATVDALVAEPPPGRQAPAPSHDRSRSTEAAPHWGALPRPLWMLEKPQALTERNNRPYSHGPLTLLAGPERIESGWWDSHLVQRDYFIASDESDMLLWIYRERLPEDGARHGWFLQGRFG
nr:DNA polymerase Y family protein [Burkholderiaceae bacterium]